VFSGRVVIDGYTDGSAASCVVEQSGRNEWGLYGVGGNVWEWTSEQDGDERILRGGSWNLNDRGGLRCVIRGRNYPTARLSHGFRLVMLR
jgi:formylglycine-generating enzyme required for sulfatase activity